MIIRRSGINRGRNKIKEKNLEQLLTNKTQSSYKKNQQQKKQYKETENKKKAKKLTKTVRKTKNSAQYYTSKSK